MRRVADKVVSVNLIVVTIGTEKTGKKDSNAIRVCCIIGQSVVVGRKESDSCTVVEVCDIISQSVVTGKSKIDSVFVRVYSIARQGVVVTGRIEKDSIFVRVCIVAGQGVVTRRVEVDSDRKLLNIQVLNCNIASAVKINPISSVISDYRMPIAVKDYVVTVYNDSLS